MSDAPPPVLRLDRISKRFGRPLDLAERIGNLFGAGRRPVSVQAVDDVTLAVAAGEVLGLVGESGCGKSTLARIAAGIMSPTEGRVLVDGKARDAVSGAGRRRADLAIQMVFQDPMASLNPRMSVAETIAEAPLVHRIVDRAGAPALVARLMGAVGLDPALGARRPHQLSGGQRARVGIARALAVEPRLVVCDESTAALDVSVQAQILNLFGSLRAELGLSLLFVSHDLGVVEHVSDRVAVMYLGRIVETAATEALFAAPNHPYTRALLTESPRIEPGRRVFRPIRGEIPSPLTPPPGCHFHPRCPEAFGRCRAEVPALRPIGGGRLSACHLNEAKPVAA